MQERLSSKTNAKGSLASFMINQTAVQHSHSSQREGFSLTEMLIVVLIMGIVAAVAQPRFAAALHAHQAVTLARHIAADIDTVRQTARAASNSKSITFNAGARTYTLNGVTNPDRRNAAYIVSLTNYSSVANFGTVNLGGDAVLSFNGFGFPDSSGTIQVIVGGSSKTINVDAVTGSTVIQ